jgi:hypothetical protein
VQQSDRPVRALPDFTNTPLPCHSCRARDASDPVGCLSLKRRFHVLPYGRWPHFREAGECGAFERDWARG